MQRLRTVFTLVVVALMAATLSSAYAQPDGGGRSGGGGRGGAAPSATGGNIGSPGMNGAAYAQPSGGGRGAAAGGERPSAAGELGAGGERPGGGPGAAGGDGAPGSPNVAGDVERPGSGPGAALGEGGLLAGGSPFADGFAPLEGMTPGDLSSRFGERGVGNLPIDGLLSQMGAEGFLAGVQNDNLQAILDARSDITGTPWNPEGEGGAPGAFADEDLDALIDERAQVGDNMAEAADNIGEAYDEFWDDYYDAVEDTADTYYDAVDYTQEAYYEAVDYTTDAIDYYIDYYENYEAYCAMYSWDCYSYTYDASTNNYYYSGDVSDAPVSTTTVGVVTTSTAVPVAAAPEPSSEAYEALVIFANDQLGAVVEPVYAGTATAEVEALLTQMPAEISAYYLNASSISGEAYWGLLSGGVAAVVVGDCTEPCTVNTEELPLEMSAASAGVYGLLANTGTPGDASGALRLITTVYPKLNGLAFSQITDIEAGFAFTATAAGIGVDPETGAALSVPKVVYAGVLDINGQPFVYALVAVGEAYVSVVG